ncbi:hypothetical protein E3P96_01356 [Wallemia ichthyophaga]|nr:hypothetical protein E3P96_01356 [Wallemia ichthyophaga]
MSYHKHKASLDNPAEIRILMVSIVGGSWNPVDVSNVFSYNRARVSVLTCLPIYEDDYPYCNFYLTDLFLRQTSPKAISNRELDAILNTQTSRNSTQNVLAHILVKVERPKAVTNTDFNLPLSLRPGRQPRPSSRGTAPSRSVSTGTRLDNFGVPMSSSSVEQEQHVLMSKFEQEQRDHELAQKLQEDLRIEDERAREVQNRQIERQQRQWAEQVAGSEMPRSEVDLVRRRNRERERLLLLRERERVQQQQQHTDRKPLSSYTADHRSLQKSTRHSPYPAMASPSWSSRPPPSTQQPYNHPYPTQRQLQMPVPSLGVPPTTHNRKPLQGARSISNMYDGYHHSDNPAVYPAVPPNIPANYVKHRQGGAQVYAPPQPQVTSPGTQMKPLPPKTYSQSNIKIPSRQVQPSPFPVHQQTLVNHPSHPPPPDSPYVMPTSPSSSTAKPPSRPYSEEELNWMHRMNQQIDQQQYRNNAPPQQPYVSPPYASPPNSARLASPGWSTSSLPSKHQSPTSDQQSRSTLVTPVSSDGMPQPSNMPTPKPGNQGFYAKYDDFTIDRFGREESTLLFSPSANGNIPTNDAISPQSVTNSSHTRPHQHNQHSSVSSIPDEHTSSSNRSSTASVDPLTPASDLNSQDRFTAEDDQEFLLDDGTNTHARQPDGAESDNGMMASGEDYSSATDDDDDEFGWKIKPADQQNTATKSWHNVTPTSPEMATIIPGRGSIVDEQPQKSLSSETIKDDKNEESYSDDEGVATWQRPPKSTTEYLSGSDTHASKQDKRKLQLIIPENNTITSEPQTTTATATSASDSGSPAQTQLRSNKISPHLLNRRRLNRGSSIRDKRNENALFRPNPEDLIDNLELYFPGHDLDRPIVSNNGDESATLESRMQFSPTNEKNNTKRENNQNNEKNENVKEKEIPKNVSHTALPSRMRRTRTIRHVAQDHRKALDRARSFRVGDDASYQSNDRSSVIYEEPAEIAREDTMKDLQDANAKYRQREDETDQSQLEQPTLEQKEQKMLSSEENLANPDQNIPIRKAHSADDKNGLRRRSTVFWGNKVVQVQPNEREKEYHILSPVTDEPSTIKWVKGDLIGKGSFGHVYLALNANTGEPLAVKQVALTAHSEEENDGDNKLVDSIKYEIELLKDLDHDRIVSYLGFERTEKYFSIFLEYVPGGSVMRCLRRHGPFEENLVRFFMKQVLDGLVYLHDSGVWHRDLKADNLLVDFEGNCKISDFGVSKAADSDAYGTNAGATNMKGTFYWMAPEVIDSVGMTGYSAKCDIWSLGCVFLEMFTAERPWPKMTMVQIVMEVGQKRSAPPVKESIKMSESAVRFKDTCFKAEPRERPTASQLLEDDFLKIDKEWNFKDSKLGQSIRSSNKHHI